MLRFLLFCAFASMPLYFFDSGGLQFTHMLFAAFFCVALARSRLQIDGSRLALIALSLWACARECIAVLQGYDQLGLMSGIYWVYNAILFSVMSREMQHDTYGPLISQGITAGTFFALLGAVWSVAMQSEVSSERPVGTFNNPNQLGYYGCCTFSLGVLLRAATKISATRCVAIALAALVMALISLSKAAIISISVSLLALGFVLSRRSRIFVGVGLLMAIGLILPYARNLGIVSESRAMHRIQSIGTQADDSIGYRGYWLIETLSASELILGIGTQGAKVRMGHEVHSTFGVVFFGYGLVGFLCIGFTYLAVLVQAARAFGVVVCVTIFTPPTLYGVTHNGSRFVAFWILLSLVSALSQQVSARRRAQMPASASWKRLSADAPAQTI